MFTFFDYSIVSLKGGGAALVLAQPPLERPGIPSWRNSLFDAKPSRAEIQVQILYLGRGLFSREPTVRSPFIWQKDKEKVNFLRKYISNLYS